MLSKYSSFVFTPPILVVRVASIFRRSSRTALRSQTLTISLLLAYLTMAQGSALAQQGCTVTSTADSGSGTLRACVAAQPRTIGFNLPPLSIITLATPIVIDLTSYSESIGLTIQGPAGGGITISGGGTTQIFQTINGDLTTSITLSDLTFTGGYTQGSGGAIQDNSGNGNLTLSNTTFYGITPEWQALCCPTRGARSVRSSPSRTAPLPATPGLGRLSLSPRRVAQCRRRPSAETQAGWHTPRSTAELG